MSKPEETGNNCYHEDIVEDVAKEKSWEKTVEEL